MSNGDAGSDLLVFSSTVATSSVYGGAGGDSIVFAGALSGNTIDFGADNDTVTFNANLGSVALTNNTRRQRSLVSWQILCSSTYGDYLGELHLRRRWK